MRVLTAAIRVWRVPGLVGAGLVVAAIARTLPAPLDVPGRSGGVEWALTPILPTLVAVAGWASFGVAHREAERITAQPTVLRRASIVVLSLGIGVLAIEVGLGEGGAANAALRNLFLLVGLAQLAISVAPVAAGWAMVVTPSAACWLLGAPLPGEAPPSWAVLLQPSTSVSAMGIAITTFIVGSTCYLASEVPLFDRWPSGAREAAVLLVGSEEVA